MDKFKVIFVLVVLALGLVYSSAYGGEQASNDDKWQIEFTTYVWLAEPDFKGTMSGQTSDVKVDFKDIINNLDELDFFAFSGRIEAWKGNWGFFIDGQYMDATYEDSLTSPIGGIEIKMDVADKILDFGTAYRLYNVVILDRMLTLAPLGGVRYHYLKQESKINSIKLGTSEDWVEPFIGVQLKYDLSKNIYAGFMFDYGGFGIGSASEHTWNLQAGIDWKFRKNMSLKLGYKIYDIEYSRYSGNKEFGMDGQLQGPKIGLTIGF
jgi:opacity protein-like surface antigen